MQGFTPTTWITPSCITLKKKKFNQIPPISHLVQERRQRKGVIVTLNAVIDFFHLVYIDESM